MVFSNNDPAEVAIQKMIDVNRKIISPQNNTAINCHLELEISTLQKAPREPNTLETLIAKKEKLKDQAKTAPEVQKLFTEIEMLKMLLYLLTRDKKTL